MTRTTKIQLLIFVLVTLLGVSYVSVEYVGLGKNLFGGDACTVSADFADSGGIFTNAEVTYRGVTIGQVGEIHIRREGIRVDLDLDDCGGARVPRDTDAVVANRSVVGEQYVDLRPSDAKGPYLVNNYVIPQSRTRIPTATNILLRNLNRLFQSVPLDDLRVTVSELGKAFAGRGNDLGRLLDSTSLLIRAAQKNLPETIALIRQSSTVLDTQLDVAPALKSWTKDLRLLSATLKSSDGDIRRLLDDGPDDLMTVQNFVKDNRTDLGVTLANLATVGDIIVNRLDGVEQILELYPGLATGAMSVLRENQPSAGRVTGNLGLVLSDDKGTPTDNNPRDCGDPSARREGYEGTTTRKPGALGPQAPNVAARCTAARGSGVSVRGSANVPGGDPISNSGGGVAYPRVITNNTIDTSLTRTRLGDGGWVALMTSSLH